MQIILTMLLFLLSNLVAQESDSLVKTEFELEQIKSENNIEDTSVVSTVGVDEPVDENEYIVGPGDMFQINLGKNLKIIVNAEGQLVLPGVPPIFVSGIILKNVKELITNSLVKKYNGKNIFITLLSTKSQKIYIKGAVKKPGAYIVDAHTNIHDLLLKAGGYNEYANRNYINVFKDSSEFKQIDLLEFYNTGIFKSRKKNPTIQFGNTVFVPWIDFAKNYAIFLIDDKKYFHQIEQEEQIRDILQKINNFSDNTITYCLDIERKNGKRVELEFTTFHEEIVQHGDRVYCYKNNQKVFVGGAVVQSKSHTFKSSYSAVDYIYDSGVDYETNKSLNYTIIRNKKKIKINSSNNFRILPGDKILVSKSLLFKTKDFISIVGSLSGVILSGATLYILLNQ